MGGTYVEFFSDESLENVMYLLEYKPDHIIYLGYKVTMVTRKMKSLKQFAGIVSPETKLEFIEVQRDNLDSCIKSLSEIADKYPDAFYELTGGGEMLLIAFGFISATKNLKTLRIDPYTGLEVNMLPGHSPSQHRDKMKISVKENIILHGGLLTRQTGSYSTWSFTTEFKEDIRIIWDIARRLEHKWNRYCSVIEDVVKANPCDETGYYVLPKSSLGEAISLLGKLNGQGMLRDFTQDNKRVRFRFKNSSIKHIVTKTGNILELHVYEVASRAPEIFTDQIIGAMIDWNGDKTETEKADFASAYEKYMHSSYDTINEIDVVLMRSTAPIFISCKSGKAGSNALHELETVTRRFGGKYASKALAMALPLESSANGSSFFRERAKEMHIWVIDNIYHLTDEELLNKLIKLQP